MKATHEHFDSIRNSTENRQVNKGDLTRKTLPPSPYEGGGGVAAEFSA